MLASGEPLIDNAAEDRFGDDELAAGLRILGILVVPVLGRDGAPIGTLEAHNSLRAFFAEDASLLQGLAAALAIAVENARARAALEHQRGELLSKQESLRTLAADLAVTEERERREIAADLHDRIGQALQISKLLVSRACAAEDVDEAREILGQAEALLASAIQDTRTLIFEISPPVLYDIGLEAAFEWLAENVTSGPAVVTYSDEGSGPPLQDTMRALVYRMTRELLMNSIKHGHATRIDITTAAVDGQLRIEVRDDGRGFDIETSPANFGLRNLREQVVGLGGRFELLSRPEHGTVARIWVPVTHDSTEASGRE